MLFNWGWRESSDRYYTEKTIGTSASDEMLYSIIQTLDSGLLLIGLKEINNEGYIYLIKTDANGNF